jgi:Co/Zn/Cd efflux system component
VLLDAVPSEHLMAILRERLEVRGDRVSDLHVWRLGPGHTGVTAAIVSDHPQAPPAYKSRLEDIQGLSHITIEVHPCPHRQDEGPAASLGGA